MSTNPDVQMLAAFIDRFEAFEQAALKQKVEVDQNSFTRLFRDYEPVDQRLRAMLLTTAPQYNIFDVLRIGHYEARVHTPFLAHLLNPKASHEQGRLFFNGFMTLLWGDDYNAALVENIEVFEEFSCCKGRIDILIQYEADKQTSRKGQ